MRLSHGYYLSVLCPDRHQKATTILDYIVFLISLEGRQVESGFVKLAHAARSGSESVDETCRPERLAYKVLYARLAVLCFDLALAHDERGGRVLIGNFHSQVMLASALGGRNLSDDFR